MMKKYHYAYLMDNQEEVHSKPALALSYMNSYLHKWRGNKTFNSAELQMVLDFVDEYFDFLSKNSRFLRQKLKEVL